MERVVVENEEYGQRIETRLVMAFFNKANFADFVSLIAELEDIDSFDGATILCTAIRYGRSDVVHHILSLGACPNHREHGGASPLSAAAFDCDVELIEFLLAHGANPDITVPASDEPGHRMNFLELFEECALDREEPWKIPLVSKLFDKYSRRGRVPRDIR